MSYQFNITNNGEVRSIRYGIGFGTIIFDRVPDRLAGLDLKITAPNEYGHWAQMEIKGMDLTPEKFYAENQFRFVAQKIIPWTPIRPIKGLLG